jgi:hypothetical protein
MFFLLFCGTSFVRAFVRRPLFLFTLVYLVGGTGPNDGQCPLFGYASLELDHD